MVSGCEGVWLTWALALRSTSLVGSGQHALASFLHRLFSSALSDRSEGASLGQPGFPSALSDRSREALARPTGFSFCSVRSIPRGLARPTASFLLCPIDPKTARSANRGGRERTRPVSRVAGQSGSPLRERRGEAPSPEPGRPACNEAGASPTRSGFWACHRQSPATLSAGAGPLPRPGRLHPQAPVPPELRTLERTAQAPNPRFGPRQLAMPA